MSEKGTTHWLHERITAVLAAPLMLWLLWSVLRLRAANHEGFTAWLAMPLNAGLMILSVIVIFYHTALGVQVIMDDYMHHPKLKKAVLTAANLFFIAAAAACIYAVLNIVLG